jgi:hypothetical protein
VQNCQIANTFPQELLRKQKILWTLCLDTKRGRHHTLPADTSPSGTRPNSLYCQNI